MTSDWMAFDIKIDRFETIHVDLHSIIATSGSSKGKPKLIWFHGVGGTALISFGLSGVLDRLVATYDIYAIDLPGFGRSTGSHSLRNMSGTKLIISLYRFL